MKYYRQFLSVLLVFVLSFVLFSTPASAETVDTSSMKVNMYAYMRTPNVTNDSQLNIPVGDGLFKSQYVYLTLPAGQLVEFRTRLTFVDTTAEPLFLKGKQYKFRAGEFVLGRNVEQYTEVYVKPNLLHYKLVYADGSESAELTNDCLINWNSALQSYSIAFDITPDKDVYKFIVWVDFDYTINSANGGKEIRHGIFYGTPYVNDGTTNTLIPMSLDIDVQSEEAGLLSGLIQWVKSIFSKIEDIFNSIIELPQKIWEFIENGLKNLFVPDSDYMSSYSDKWDELLSSRFGAIYDVASIIRDFVGQIQVADKTNTIYMPVVNLNSAGIPFSFGGYEIQIVPTGFTTIVEICKKILSIACTFLFVNSLRKRYDEVMGVEQ